MAVDEIHMLSLIAVVTRKKTSQMQFIWRGHSVGFTHCCFTPSTNSSSYTPPSHTSLGSYCICN